MIHLNKGDNLSNVHISAIHKYHFYSQKTSLRWSFKPSVSGKAIRKTLYKHRNGSLTIPPIVSYILESVFFFGFLSKFLVSDRSVVLLIKNETIIFAFKSAFSTILKILVKSPYYTSRYCI